MSEIEKAIQVLKVRANFTADINLDAQMAYKLAIQALQEKLERENGCNECNKISCSNCKWQRCCSGRPMETKCTARDYKYEPRKYCNECGKNLEHIGEATNMVEGENHE